MTGEGFPSFPHASGHGRALAARTHGAVPDDADYRNPEPLVARVNAYGNDTSVVVLHSSPFSARNVNRATVQLTPREVA